MATLHSILRFLVFVLVGLIGPLHSWLRKISRPASHPYSPLNHTQWAQFWALILRWNCGMRMHLYGSLLPESQVVVANHLGYLDILAFLAGGGMNFVSKSDVGGWPLLGNLARSAGTIFLNRESKMDLPRVMSRFSGVIESGSRVIFFPEGTSSDGREVLPFHSSLFEIPAKEGWRIQPAAIYYVLGSGVEGHASTRVCYWGDMEFVPHFRQLLRIPRIECHIRFGSGTVSGTNRKSLCAEVEKEVRELHRQLREELESGGNLGHG